MRTCFAASTAEQHESFAGVYVTSGAEVAGGRGVRVAARRVGARRLRGSMTFAIISFVPSGDGWGNPDRELVQWIDSHRQRATDAYKANPVLVEEHGRQEDAYRTGGYASRQVVELVQNAADAQSRSRRRGRIELLLRDDVLYCANQGDPFNRQGLEAITHAYLSDKREEEIGRFGLGFKSILGITDAPMVLSRSVSFAFRAAETRDALRLIAPESQQFPVLRLPHTVDADQEIARDSALKELAPWAETIVKIPISKNIKRLIEDLQTFPSEFLLFAPSVSDIKIAVDVPPETGTSLRALSGQQESPAAVHEAADRCRSRTGCRVLPD